LKGRAAKIALKRALKLEFHLKKAEKMARRDLTHKEMLAEWMDFDAMIPKKCSDAHTMWKMIVEQKDFCKKTWEEQMRIKEEEASILFTKYNDLWDKGYQDSYTCKQVKIKKRG
jgi:glucosamine 6-phosphate synthetase-like amidotransferase/phosphosugar isomerase protein